MGWRKFFGIFCAIYVSHVALINNYELVKFYSRTNIQDKWLFPLPLLYLFLCFRTKYQLLSLFHITYGKSSNCSSEFHIF